MTSHDLAHNVRGWVHYDNMCATLQKQVINSRNERDKFEKEIEALLKQQQMGHAVIQISGGQLQLQEEKSTSGLSMKSIQESLKMFFKSHTDLPDKSSEIFEFIKQQRTIHTTTKLKKLKS